MQTYRIHLKDRVTTVTGFLHITDGFYIIKNNLDTVFGPEASTIFVSHISNVEYIRAVVQEKEPV